MVIIVIICLIVCCFCNMISNIYKYLNKCQELEIDKKKIEIINSVGGKKIE